VGGLSALREASFQHGALLGVALCDEFTGVMLVLLLPALL
jgi:hypothetical protein